MSTDVIPAAGGYTWKCACGYEIWTPRVGQATRARHDHQNKCRKE